MKKLYFEARQDYSLCELAKKLNLHTGTLKRWESQERIPGDYLIDLNSILGNKYKIQKENYRQNCEFFTKHKSKKWQLQKIFRHAFALWRWQEPSSRAYFRAFSKGYKASNKPFYRWW